MGKGGASRKGGTAPQASSRYRLFGVVPKRHCFALIALFIFYLSALAAVWYNAPKMTDEELAKLKMHGPFGLPKTLDDVKTMRDVLLGYAESYQMEVMGAFCLLYVGMQTFAIPGTITLSLLAGGLFGFKIGLPLVAVISTMGSSICFCLSWMFGRAAAEHLWPKRMAAYRNEIVKRQDELLSYVVILRIMPVPPNTFINVASPVVGVPLNIFALGTLLGCMPNNIAAVSAGTHLSEMTSLKEIYNGRTLAMLGGVGLAAAIPLIAKRLHRSKLD